MKDSSAEVLEIIRRFPTMEIKSSPVLPADAC